MIQGTVKTANLSLTKPISFGGVERELMIVNLCFTSSLIFVSKFSWMIIVGIAFGIIFHLFAKWFYRLDPHMVKVYQRYRRYSTATTRYLFAQKSILSRGFKFYPRSISVKGMKNITVTLEPKR